MGVMGGMAGPHIQRLGTCLSPRVIRIVTPGGMGSARRPVGRDTPRERTTVASHRRTPAAFNKHKLNLEKTRLQMREP